jgi:hypothetical protein
MATNGTWIDEDVHHLPKAEAATHRAAVDKEAAPELALAPLVDKIAYGLARGLVVAFKELENHIASETHSVGDKVGRRLDSLQASFQDLSDGVSQQRALSLSVQEQCQQLAAATTSLQESVRARRRIWLRCAERPGNFPNRSPNASKCYKAIRAADSTHSRPAFRN